jgi:2-polyprenyl-6-methoxyphenol hydroxylase-like FAD-dependent oxidoreductase
LPQAEAMSSATSAKNQAKTRPGAAARVVIVGAGPAGAALAFLLARRGVEVVLIERQHDFAREFRGEALMPTGVDAISQMGLRSELDSLPHTELAFIDFYVYRRGPFRLVLGSPAADFRIRLVSQPLMLEMLATQAAQFPSFHLERGSTVRDLVFDGQRVIGVQLETATASREIRADLVVGADGRSSIIRKRAQLHEQRSPQAFDVIWGKVPLPDFMSDRCTARFFLNRRRAALAFPAADGQMQFGWLIEKGSFGELKSRGIETWFSEMAKELPADMAAHLLANRGAVAHPFLLDVICDRLVRWTAPGLLLLGDAAHPMSPVGGQGINMALRDALVAANYLCPVLMSGAGLDAVDAAARRVQAERLPEVEEIQKGQQQLPPFLFGSTLSARIVRALALRILAHPAIMRRALLAAHDRLVNGVTRVRLQV